MCQDWPNKNSATPTPFLTNFFHEEEGGVYFHFLQPWFLEFPFSKITNREYLKNLLEDKSTLTIKILMIAIIMIQAEQM